MIWVYREMLIANFEYCVVTAEGFFERVYVLLHVDFDTIFGHIVRWGELLKPATFYAEEKTVPPKDPEEVHAYREALFLAFEKKHKASVPMKTSAHWYEVIRYVINTFTDKDFREVVSIINAWEFGEEQRTFTDQEKDCIERYKRLFGIDEIPPGQLISIISKMEADSIIDPLIATTPEGNLMLDDEGDPILDLIDLQCLIRIKQFTEYQYGVASYEREYRLYLLEFYHSHKDLLKTDFQLMGLLKDYYAPKYGVEKYPVYEITKYKRIPIEITPDVSKKYTDYSNANAAWIGERNARMLQYCMYHLEKSEFNVVLFEGGVCDILEMERYKINYINSLERRALDGGTYSKFLRENAETIAELKKYASFNNEKKVYALLEAKLNDSILNQYYKFLNEDLEKRFSRGKKSSAIILLDEEKLVDRLKVLFLLSEKGYFTNDFFFKKVVETMIKYEWPRYLKDKTLSPSTIFYLNFLKPAPSFFQYLHDELGVSEILCKRLESDPTDLKRFLLENRFAKLISQAVLNRDFIDEPKGKPPVYGDSEKDAIAKRDWENQWA